MMSLNGSQNELTRCLEHQKHQSEVISSLEYQFAELNAQKQRLFDEVTQSMSLNESTVNELRAQVAQLSSDLTRVTAELQEAQHRADNLKNELDAARLGKSLNDVTTATATTTTSTSPCRKQCTDAGVCTEFVFLLDRRAGDVMKSSTPSSHVQPSVWVDLESKVALDQLREQLSAAQDRYKKTVRERNEARKQQKASVAELQRYKNTLMETEYLLAKLQEFVGESERKWRQLLTESENERNQLAARLGESNKKTQEVTKKLKETERKLAGGKEPPNPNLCGKIKKTGGQRSKERSKPQLPRHEDPMISGTTEFASSEVVRTTLGLSLSRRRHSFAMDGITSIQVASPTCADDVETSFIEAVTAENDHGDPEMMGTSKDANSVCRNAQKPHIGETPSTVSKNLPTTCDVVDDTWIAVAPSLALDGDNGPCPASNDLLYVSARPVSGARWTSSVQDIETAQLAPPLGLDTDNDSDAVVVDDTDLHVPDDIWDSVTKPNENSPADSIPTDVPDENSAASVDQSEIPPIPPR
ncbi:hypothetical protein FGIG_00704 [Fasciola gigantica]|uniref:Uncharacterized protein n=1 Tax=Fasciola gigantica TaxID=46835 RepID=A0A504YG62_FASGI|nr:hypothetical protein FGIG_00704 [Fasciola gigantica]